MITGKLVAVTLLCALAGICLSTGCSGVISPAPSSPPSPTPIATASPTLTPTLTVTRLPLPTATMVPTTTSTPTITRTPSPVAEDMSGWTAKQGGPDGARANLTSRVAAPVGLAWEWQEQDNRPVAIAATGDFVFLLTGRGQLCILDAATGAKKTCRTIWPDTKGSTSGQIALNGDTVLVSALELYIKPGDRYGTARTRLSAFSMDGQPRWMSPIVDNQSGEAIVAGEGVVVYVSRTDVDQYWLTALDLTTGLQRWRIPGSFEHAATDGKVLYMAGQSVSALHLSTGARLWEQITGARHVLYSQGRVIAVGDNTIVALDAPTGKVMWKKDFGVFPLTGEEVGIAAAHGRVYVKPAPGQTPQGYRTGVMALDAASGKELWSAGAGPDRWVNQIAATADSLVVTGQEWDGNTFARRLWLLNPANGAELDRSVVSPDPMDEMNGLAVAGDRVYVLGRSLRVFRPTPRK